MIGVEHWAETRRGVEATTPPRQVRLRRARLVNDILSFQKLRVDDWQGAAMIVAGPTGRTEIADSLADLWPKAERVSGRPLDPLDPALLEHLRRVAGG